MAPLSYPIAFYLLPLTRVPDDFVLPSNPALGRAVSGKWKKMWDKRTGVVAREVAEAVLA
jgi:hypothetical protein